MKTKRAPAKPPEKKSPLTVFLPSLIIVIMLLVVLCRPYGVASRKALSVDEALYNVMAEQMVNNIAGYNTQRYYEREAAEGNVLPSYLNKPLFKHPPLYTLILSLQKKFNVRGLKNTNFFSFYAASLLILLVFFMARKLYDNRTAFIAFLFLAIEPICWSCSLRLWMECHLALLMYASLFLFVLGWEDENYLLVSGFFAGLAMLTKYPGGLVLPIIAAFAALYKPELLRNVKFYLLFVIAFLTFSPWIFWNLKVYGNFLSNLDLHADAPLVRNFLRLAGSPALFAFILALLAFWAAALKGYLSAVEQKIGSNKTLCFLVAALFCVFILSLKSVRTGLVESFLLNKVPPHSIIFPSIFANEPWDFYLGQLLKMSPIFILSFLGPFLLVLNNNKDKLFLITAMSVMAFFIYWGNYQSRYVVPAIPALIILASRVIVVSWDALKNLPNRAMVRPLQYMIIGAVFYFVLKTIMVDIALSAAFYSEDFFIYF